MTLFTFIIGVIGLALVIAVAYVYWQRHQEDEVVEEEDGLWRITEDGVKELESQRLEDGLQEAADASQVGWSARKALWPIGPEDRAYRAQAVADGLWPEGGIYGPNCCMVCHHYPCNCKMPAREPNYYNPNSPFGV